MKKSSLICLFTVLVAIIAIMMTPIVDKCSTLFSLSISQPSAVSVYPDDFYDCEEALKDGDIATARRIIQQGKLSAKDSNDYYAYVVLDSKYFFSTMQIDSFKASHRLLQAYLQRQQGQNDLYIQRFTMENMLQRGVYEAKMVGNMDSAIVYYQRALDIADRFPEIGIDRLMILTNFADAYKQIGSYDQSVSYFQQAMELGDSLGMSNDTRVTLCIGIASAYAAMGSFNESANWWNQAEALKPTMHRGELFQYLNNRGNDYYLQGAYEESLKCFQELDSIIGNDSTMLWERMYEWANMSDVYIKLGHPERAVTLLDKTQPFFTKQQQFIPLFYLITQRIELALLSGNMEEANRLIADSPIPDQMIPEQKQLRRKVLLLYYEKNNQWQQYGETLRDYIALRDSIASDNIKMRFSEVLLHYEHEKKMIQKQRLLEEKELSFHWALSLLVAAIVVIILLVIIFVQKHRERKLRDREIRGSMAELRMETVRNRITPHFISNALAAEMVAQMEGKTVNLDELVQLLHRGIELTDIKQSTLSEELTFIQFYCNVESRSVGDDFQLDIELAQDIDADQVLLPTMLIQILVENAIKHGLKAKKPQPGKKRCVLVRAKAVTNATLVEVIDNGVGLSTHQKIRERTGLRVMHQTIRLLNEKHQQEHDHGHDDVLMEYGLENYKHADGDSGCRGWLVLPNDFDYTLPTVKDFD